MTKKSTPDHFWAMVNKTKDCWEWTGAVNNTGYGTLSYQGQHATAHRVAAYITGITPTIMAPKNRKASGFILHKCDNRRCCNPDHMRVGTYAENQLDAYQKRRKQQPKGEAHANAKQTKESVILIKDLYAHGVSQEAIAKLLQVSQSGISKIILGTSYVETF